VSERYPLRRDTAIGLGALKGECSPKSPHFITREPALPRAVHSCFARSLPAALRTDWFLVLLASGLNVRFESVNRADPTVIAPIGDRAKRAVATLMLTGGRADQKHFGPALPRGTAEGGIARASSHEIAFAPLADDKPITVPSWVRFAFRMAVDCILPH
jgi:hypothetical protein